MPVADIESLAQYVARILKEKNLKHHEVKELSGGRITDGYERGIMTGKASNPRVDKLKALALGLGVSEDEIFRVARGLPVESDDKWKANETNYQVVLDIIVDSRKNRTLAELLSEASRLSGESLEQAVGLLKYLNSRKQKSPRSKQKA
jgi:transcriptional regulator with XRE-family HTH domain